MITRPQTLKDYVGQARVRGLVAKELEGGAFPRHMLFYGMPGLGKTSLAGVVAREAGLTFHSWQASKEMTGRRLTQLLFDLPIIGYTPTGHPVAPGIPNSYSKHLVFIDEVHELPEFEPLYPVLEDRTLNPDPNGGTSWLPYTCFIVATTDPNKLPKAFKDRFALDLRLDPYSVEDLGAMIRSHLGTAITKPDALNVARRARGNARKALTYAESVIRHGMGYFEAMGIDSDGLTPLDRAVLDALVRAGRPISLNTLAAMVQESPATLRDVVEPALIAAGRMEITPKGRQAVGALMGGSRGTLEAYAG